jgi:S1-C subfamily serine protease
VNLLDLALVLLIVAATVAGARSGLLPQVGGLLGAAAGGVSAVLALPWATDLLAGLDPLPRALAVIAGLLGAVVLGEGLGSTLGRVVQRAIDGGLLGILDGVGGALVGALQGVLVAWLTGGLLAVGPFPTLAAQAQTSFVVRGLADVLPPPTSLVDELAAVIDASGLPDVFVGLEPIPAPPVELPSDAQTRAIAAAAAGSTVKVTSQACRATLLGSGVVVARGYVVTNAHVVAGATATRVSGGGLTVDATVVLFDPELDVALLYAPRLRAGPLRFATAEPARGSVGAALGYPNGGPLKVVPAAVGRQLVAEGRDIYGRTPVERSILELRADIARGDSGGPFVLADGTVGGLVFAESRADPGIGYALSPVDVSVRIAPAIGRTAAVGTGPCLR